MALEQKEEQINKLRKDIDSHKNSKIVSESYFENYGSSKSKLTQSNVLKHDSKMSSQPFKTPNFHSPVSSTRDSKL